MNSDLDVELVGDAKAAIDGGRGGAPVFMKLKADRAGEHLLAQRFRSRAVAFAQEPKVHRVLVGGLQHAVHVPDPGRAGRGISSSGWAGAAADHGGDAAGERMV